MPIVTADIEGALNRAHDLIDQEVALSGRDYDLINLLINVALHSVKYPKDSLTEAIRANYNTPVEEVLSWLE